MEVDWRQIHYLTLFVGAFAVSFLGYIVLIKGKDCNCFLKYLHVPAKKSDSNAILLGGLPFAISSMFALSVLILFMEYSEIFYPGARKIIGFWLIGAVPFVFYGLLDDLFEIRARVKLIAQGIGGILFAYMTSSILFPQFSSIAFAVILFLGFAVVNGANLMDGLDTLTIKTGISSFTIFAILGLLFQVDLVVICSILFASSLSGFYYFNREPAKIHMGEIGGSLIGFCMLLLSCLLFRGITSQIPVNGRAIASISSHASTIMASIFPLVFPITELAVSFLRRVINRKSPFAGDRMHIHHIIRAHFKLSPARTSGVIALFYLTVATFSIIFGILSMPWVGTLFFAFCQLGIYYLFGKDIWFKKTKLANMSLNRMFNHIGKKDITVIDMDFVDDLDIQIVKGNDTPLEDSNIILFDQDIDEEDDDEPIEFDKAS